MHVLVALVFAAASAFAASFVALMVATPWQAETPPALFFGAAVAGFALSLVYMLRGARSVPKVAARGFLVGAGLWLAFIPLSWIAGARTPGADAEGMAFGGMFMGAFGVAMAAACLVGYAVARAFGKERAGDATKKCPRCAEMVQPDAAVCRFCGCDFATTAYVA